MVPVCLGVGGVGAKLDGASPQDGLVVGADREEHFRRSADGVGLLAGGVCSHRYGLYIRHVCCCVWVVVVLALTSSSP